MWKDVELWVGNEETQEGASWWEQILLSSLWWMFSWQDSFPWSSTFEPQTKEKRLGLFLLLSQVIVNLITSSFLSGKFLYPNIAICCQGRELHTIFVCMRLSIFHQHCLVLKYALNDIISWSQSNIVPEYAVNIPNHSKTLLLILLFLMNLNPKSCLQCGKMVHNKHYLDRHLRCSI